MLTELLLNLPGLVTVDTVTVTVVTVTDGVDTVDTASVTVVTVTATADIHTVQSMDTAATYITTSQPKKVKLPPKQPSERAKTF